MWLPNDPANLLQASHAAASKASEAIAKTIAEAQQQGPASTSTAPGLL